MSTEYNVYSTLITVTVNQNLINIILNMEGKKRKHKHKVILKLTKQQLEMVEDQYWKRYNDHKLNTMLYR